MINPFTTNGNRTLGQNWVLPSLSTVLSQLGSSVTSSGVSGYGCFLAPTSKLGYPLDFTIGGTITVSIDSACRPGFFCPYLDIANVVTYPVVCPTSETCFFNRDFGILCDYPMGVFEPMACPRGFYCPTYNQALVCPSGSYCLSGSSSPTSCTFLSLCPAGSVTQKHYGILFIALVIDVLLVVVVLLLKYQESLCTNPDKKPFKLSFNSRAKDAQPQRAAKRKESMKVSDIEADIKALTAGFHKGLDGHTDLSMNYDFRGLSLKLPDGKDILQGVTGSIRAGRMTAIMGPSGSGKTTFMSVLMGKVARTAGTLKISGTLAEMKDFKKLIGYVPQEDIMIEELTVRENIRYAARTKLPNSWTNMEVDDHVDSILKALNLTHVAHKRIGGTLVRGISGGQRKRVNIGMELAAAPLSVFLDEPTSGLDSTSALDVANILLSVSRLGLTIVSVIHQPRVEIFEIFDDILMIAPGGITAYIGPTTGVQAYFESLGFIFKSHSNVADTLMDILAGRGEVRNGISESITRPSEIVAKWRERDANNVASMEVETPPVYAATAIESMRQVAKLRGASFIRQFGLSHNRSLLQQSRLFTAFIIEAFVGFLCGLIMGIASGGGEALTGMFIQPYTALGASPKYWFVGLYGLLVGLSISLAATPSGVKVFGEEKAVYLREAEAGHNIHAYYLGKNLASIYRVILSAGHFCGIYYLLAQPPIDIGIQFAIIFLNFVGTYGVGMMVSMVVKRENAPLLGVTIALIWEVLCGFGPSITDATDGGYIFLYDIGVNRWMAETQFTLWVEAYNIYDKTIAANVFGYQFGNTARNIGLMVVVCIGYRIITYLLFLANIYSGSLNIWISKITSARRASPQASSKRVEQEAFHADVEEESATVDSEK